MAQGPEETYKDYTVYDQHYEKVGKVDDLFVDENDRPEYIGVKMGLLGTKSTLIPIELVRVNDRRKLVEVAASEEKIKNAPTFNDDRDITPEYEHGVYGYFGLQPPGGGQERSAYGGYYASDAYSDEELRRSVDTEYGERTEDPEVSSTEPTTTTTTTTSSSETGGTNLDIPVEDTGRSGSGTDLTGGTQGTGEGQRSDVEVQGDRNVRVYKRTRAVGG